MSRNYTKELFDLEKEKVRKMSSIPRENLDYKDKSFYGFIPSEFRWISLDEQKSRANELISKTKQK